MDAFSPVPSIVFLGLRLSHWRNGADIGSLDVSYAYQTKGKSRVLMYLWSISNLWIQPHGDCSPNIFCLWYGLHPTVSLDIRHVADVFKLMLVPWSHATSSVP